MLKSKDFEGGFASVSIINCSFRVKCGGFHRRKITFFESLLKLFIFACCERKGSQTLAKIIVFTIT